MPTTPRAVAATLTLLLAFCMDTGWAADPAPGGRPAGQVIRRNVADNALFASSIWAGDTLYVSGMLPTPAAPADAPAGTRPAISGDTKAQTLSALTGIQKTLREQGLVFVGIDVIGDYMTEINVTSPTGIQEINRLNGVALESLLWDAIETRLGYR